MSWRNPFAPSSEDTGEISTTRRVSNDTGEYPAVRLRPEDIGQLLPTEALASWALQKLVHEQDFAPDSEDAIESPLDSFLTTDISNEEWNAWEDDWDSVHDSPVVSTEDWLNPNAMLQYSLARMETLTEPEVFERQLRSLLRQYHRLFPTETHLTRDTISILNVLFERLYRYGVRFIYQREHRLALTIFQWLTLARPRDKKITVNIQKLSNLIRVG